MGRKSGRRAVSLWGGSWVTILHNVAGAEAYLCAKLHLDPSNRLATIHQCYRQYRQTGQTVYTNWHFANHCLSSFLENFKFLSVDFGIFRLFSVWWDLQACWHTWMIAIASEVCLRHGFAWYNVWHYLRFLTENETESASDNVKCCELNTIQVTCTQSSHWLRYRHRTHTHTMVWSSQPQL